MAVRFRLWVRSDGKAPGFTSARGAGAMILRMPEKQGNMRQHASCLQSNDITTVCMVMLAPSNPHFKRIFSVICRRFHKFRDHEDKTRNKCRIWIWDSLL